MSYREIVRQQYHFSPPGTTTEREHYSLNLEGVTNIELTIIPDIAVDLFTQAFPRLRIDRCPFEQ